MIARQDIQIRDPFILPVRKDNRYYLYGTTDKEPWAAQGIGFDVYYSDNLNHWNGPFAAFRPQFGFWADKCFWAPEVHDMVINTTCSPVLSRRSMQGNSNPCCGYPNGTFCPA